MRRHTTEQVPWCPGELVLSGAECYDIAPRVTNKHRGAMANVARVIANCSIRRMMRTNHGKQD